MQPPAFGEVDAVVGDGVHYAIGPAEQTQKRRWRGMGFQIDKGSFELEIQGGQYDVTALADAFSALEYPYNLLAFASRYADGDRDEAALGVMMQAIAQREALGPARANCVLRGLLERDATLRVVDLSMESPIRVQFRGIADAIRAVQAFFHPAEWRRIGEEERHLAAMNPLREEQERIKTRKARLELAEKELRTMTNIAQLAGRFRSTLERHCDPEQADAIASVVRQELLREVTATIQAGIEIKALP